MALPTINVDTRQPHWICPLPAALLISFQHNPHSLSPRQNYWHPFGVATCWHENIRYNFSRIQRTNWQFPIDNISSTSNIICLVDKFASLKTVSQHPRSIVPIRGIYHTLRRHFTHRRRRRPRSRRIAARTRWPSLRPWSQVSSYRLPISGRDPF